MDENYRMRHKTYFLEMIIFMLASLITSTCRVPEVSWTLYLFEL